jgi:hypothetical protein
MTYLIGFIQKKGLSMKAFTRVCFLVMALQLVVHAKNTYSAFSLGCAIPASPTGAQTSTDPALPDEKKLGMGWDAGWTFFGFPFSESGPALSGLALGGKINYNRWVRDSTRKELTFLGTQGIVRYNMPFDIKPFDLFVQAGCGMFIGEHGFADPDTIPPVPAPSPVERVVSEGIKNLGVSFNIGIDWDVLEFTPGLTMVFTKGKPSTWLSISAAAKF